mmetsp:Transcript_16514/g.42373  ORF Transcript_16514/g.42373 Transcript_16514/m.42373 type:complete len:358 (-) Transcript_16514:430-1503(-)
MQEYDAAILEAIILLLLAIIIYLVWRSRSSSIATSPVGDPPAAAYKLSQSGRWEKEEDDGSRLHPTAHFGYWGRGTGELINPRFLLALGEGVLVADSGNDRLQIFSAEGKPVRAILGSLPGHPTGLATDGTHLWVADSSNCSVSKLRLSDGQHEFRTGCYGSDANEFSGPEGLALFNDILFIADEGNHRIAMLDATTMAWRGAFGTKGSECGQLLNPVGLTIIGCELYVRDTNNHRIQVFDVSGAGSGIGVCGAFLRSFGGHGDAPGCFVQPTGMAHDGRGRLLVSEAGAKRVQVLTTEGAPLQVLPLPKAGRLYGMCVSNERAYIADYEQHQVHVLELKNEPLPPSPQHTPTKKRV